MARPRLPIGDKKHKVTLNLSSEFLEWLDAQTGARKRFKDRTQAVEFAISVLMDGMPLFQIRERTDDGRVIIYRPGSRRSEYVGEFKEGQAQRRHTLELVEDLSSGGGVRWPEHLSIGRPDQESPPRTRKSS